MVNTLKMGLEAVRCERGWTVAPRVASQHRTSPSSVARHGRCPIADGINLLFSHRVNRVVSSGPTGAPPPTVTGQRPAVCVGRGRR